MANFYEQYVKPYVTSAAQSVAIDIAVKQFVDRGMTQEDAYRAAYQLVTGQTLPVIETSFWSKKIFGIKIPILIAGGVGIFIALNLWKGK